MSEQVEISAPGHSGHVLYRRWSDMMRRCYRKNNPDYDSYGGRGIKVYETWYNIANYIGYVENVLGPMPFPKAQIDRKDNNGNYEPGNIRWASNKENCRNKRNNVVATIDGETKLVLEWAEQKVSIRNITEYDEADLTQQDKHLTEHDIHYIITHHKKWRSKFGTNWMADKFKTDKEMIRLIVENITIENQ